MGPDPADLTRRWGTVGRLGSPHRVRIQVCCEYSRLVLPVEALLLLSPPGDWVFLLSSELVGKAHLNSLAFQGSCLGRVPLGAWLGGLALWMLCQAPLRVQLHCWVSFLGPGFLPGCAETPWFAVAELMETKRPAQTKLQKGSWWHKHRWGSQGDKIILTPQDGPNQGSLGCKWQNPQVNLKQKKWWKKADYINT